MLITAPEMMKSRPFDTSNPLPIPSFPISITNTARQEALRLAQECPEARREQIYRNAIARFAVNHYLQCLGIETNLITTNFQIPLCRSLLDVTDIELPTLGRIECCPTVPGERQVRIPKETWDNRIAYLAVELDLEVGQAVLLGFINHLDVNALEKKCSEIVSLESFRDIDELPDVLHDAKPIFIELKQWWSNLFEDDWFSLEELLRSDDMYLTDIYHNQDIHGFKQKIVEFLGEPSLQPACRSVKQKTVSGFKLISLSLEKVQPSSSKGLSHGMVALVLHANEGTEHDYEVLIDVVPGPRQEYLPPDLRLSLLGDNRSELLFACTQSKNRHLQLEFSGDLDDSVTVQLSLGALNFEEKIVL